MNDLLPIDGVLPDILASLSRHCSLILVAEPGAGKTTRVPLALMDQPWLQGRKIIMLEPRRVAARAAARRMAASLGEAVGDRVGYAVRLDRKISAKTKIEVVTEGILTRRLQADPELADVGLIIFDEFHERSLDGDLALALAREAQEALRPDLKIMVMSATLDVEALGRVLMDAPLLEAPGRAYPVEVHYLDKTSRKSVVQDVAKAIRLAVREHAGSILAFLPGEGEIKRCADMLQGEDAIIAPLYGALSPAEQDRAIQPAAEGQRKIVLATTIAETSLTIEGVSVVVDCGLKRVAQFDPASGMTRLETVRVSLASAEQRRGRAGRTGSGHCYRLWPQAENLALKPHDLPEILSADLTGFLLELAQWGVQDTKDLSLLDQPPAGAFAQARDLLVRLEALDAQGQLTAMGVEMLCLPLHPRLAHMVIKGREMGAGGLAADMAAILSERSQARDVDLSAHLSRLSGMMRESAKQIRQLAQIKEKGSRAAPGLLLSLAYPDRLGQQRGKPGQFRLSGGGSAILPETDAMAREAFLAIATTDGAAANAKIHLASPITLSEIEANFQLETKQFVSWNAREEIVQARMQKRLGELILEDKPLQNPDAELLQQAMLEGIRSMGLDCLAWTEAAQNFRARVNFLARVSPQLNLPALDDDAIFDALPAWLSGITRKSHLDRLNIYEILASLVPYEIMARLNELAPPRLKVPSGAEWAIDYETENDPVLRVRLQEMFGLKETPRIAGGKIALRIELLSPAQRPLAVTQDLASFWVNAYPSVRSEMRGRYPKHFWPDNPLEAAPVAPRRLR